MHFMLTDVAILEGFNTVGWGQEGYQAYKNLLQQSAKVLWEPSLTGSNLWKNRLIKENC